MAERLHCRKYLKSYRKNLRNNPTFSEARLWSCLKNKQLHGRRFRRQHSIGNYIVDFFCYSEKLIIEVDGTSHNEAFAEDYDIERDRCLKNLGFNIIRIPSDELIYNLEGILEDITHQFKNSD